jgi:hypothetical protein
MPKRGEPKVYRPFPEAERTIRSAMKDLSYHANASLNVADVFAVLDENEARRAKNAALFREMSQPLPGLDVPA